MPSQFASFYFTLFFNVELGLGENLVRERPA